MKCWYTCSRIEMNKFGRGDLILYCNIAMARPKTCVVAILEAQLDP